MSSTSPVTESAERDGSRLCLACGICCQGVLHRGARITDDEIDTVKRLGLNVIGSEQGPVFSLPCPLHLDDRCTVYTERPSPCRAYQCKLLRRYLTGEATWDESIRRVQLAKDLVAGLRQRIGGAVAGNSVWQQIAALQPAPCAEVVADRELLMDAVALLTFCQQHFLNRAQPLEVLGP